MLLERRVRLNFGIPRGCKVLAALLLFSSGPAGTIPLSAKDAPQQAPATNPYDAASFALEMNRLKRGLENVRLSSADIGSIRESLPDTWTVTVGKQRFDVPTSPLVARLTKAEREPEVRQLQLNQARDYLVALAAESSSLSALPSADTSFAKAALDRILAQPEYTNRRQPSWWDRLREQVNNMIAAALMRILSRIGSQRSLGQVLLWIGICTAAVLIAYWLFRRWLRAARLEEMAIQSSTIPARSWQQWIFASRTAAERRDYRLAIHSAYWAGIARLEDLGTVSSDRAKTPREYLNSLTESKLIVPETYAARYQALSAMTARLERTWYGYHTATETDFRDSLAQLEILGCHLP